MTRTEAIAKLRRLLGPRAYWRVGAHLTSPERRHAAHLERLELDFHTAMLAKDMAHRAKTLLDADPAYCELKADYARAKRAKAKLPIMPAYRFEVGTTSDVAGFNALHVRAYGDTWEEVFAKLQAEQKVAP